MHAHPIKWKKLTSHLDASMNPFKAHIPWSLIVPPNEITSSPPKKLIVEAERYIPLVGEAIFKGGTG